MTEGRFILLGFVTAVSVILAGCQPNEATSLAETQGNASRLWGEAGALWDPSGRLPDFAFAGYRTGVEPLPLPTARVNVRTFGARGDDNVDDTAAIQRAIESAAPGQVVWIPDGTYILSDRLMIMRSDVVLRGESEEGVRLDFRRSLMEIAGPESVGLEFPNVAAGGGKRWSFIGGLVWVEGCDPISADSRLARLVGVIPRGSRTIEVDDAASLAVGQWIRLVMTDPKDGPLEGSLLRHLHDDLTVTGTETGWRLFEFASRIEAIRGPLVTLERRLPLEIRPEWQPELHPFAPTVQEVGIEKLTLSFPDVASAPHLQEPGFNGIYFYRVANSWIRDVTIKNADSGVFFNFATFNTITRLTIDASPLREHVSDVSGHHGIGLGWLSADNLIVDFEIATKYIHDITVETAVRGNVFSMGRGVDINLDHHKKAPYQNLFTQLHLGAGARPFASSGPQNGGPQSAARNTYWSIHADGALDFPPKDFGPRLNFVGVSLDGAPNHSLDWHVEMMVDGARVSPPNLHLAQLARRTEGDTGSPPN